MQVNLDINEHPFLFSTTTKFAYNIDNDFYKGKHYVWVALKFDDLDVQAANSNPLTIAINFINEVRTADGHCDRIFANIVGVRNGAREMMRLKNIDKKASASISRRIKEALYEDFLPLVYVIDTRKVFSRIEEVPPDAAAKPTSPEYKIMDLHEGEYELIDLGIIINAAKRFDRRRLSDYASYKRK